MSTTFARRPLTTNSRRRGCAWAAAGAIRSQPTKARPATAPAAVSTNSRRVMVASSHAGAETTGGAHGHCLAHVGGRVQQRDGAEHGRPRTAGHVLADRLRGPTPAAVADGPRDVLRLEHTLPVVG